MDRRKFIRNSSVAGLSVTALSFAACNSASSSKEDNKDVSRITFEVIYTSDKIAESGVLKLSMYTNVSKVENVDVLLFETEFLITVIRGKNAILFKP